MSNTTKAAPVRATQAPAPVFRKADERVEIDPLDIKAYNLKQIDMVFASIAGMAGTVCDSLRMSIGSGEEVDASLLLIVISQIGGLADFMTGYDIIGDPLDWNIGRGFRTAGEA